MTVCAEIDHALRFSAASHGPVVPVPDPERCIHQRFEAQAARTPDAEAVRLDDRSLTYRELNERANRLAHHLRRAGVGPDRLVGISLPRSLEMLVGIYGILKAGGAYVPLDPAYPPKRLATMVETSKLSILVTESGLANLFDTLPGLEVIELDRRAEALAKESADNPLPVAGPENLIYVIFTSGSTGRPKAAAVYHKGFTNLMHWFVTAFEVTAADRTLLVSSLSFDLTQKNLYASLINGGSLHLYPPGPYDVSLLARLVEERGITLINCTPSAFYPLIEPPDDEALRKLASLRVVFLGGEPISIPRLRPWMTHPTCRADMANTYGPTECTDICGAYRLTRETLDAYPFVPLGRPVFNVDLAIVDPDMRPCAVGVPGELCVAGAGVGAGYLNDPEMTAARFIANPFPDIAGPTLYRTGDQARWLPDGVIEFLGRIDHQVKIRGFRIELHEIESALNTHPGVREAIVIVEEARTGGGDPRLVCFFTTNEGGEPCASDLKRHLSDRLPEYMTPSAFHRLEKFPLSPNGKVDRHALRDLSPARPAPARPAAQAANDMESAIRQIWLDVLHGDEAGLDDNFFDLGGNSLHLAEIHMRLRRHAGRDFPITDLFAHTTIRSLASHLSRGATAATPVNAFQERARRAQHARAIRRVAQP